MTLNEFENTPFNKGMSALYLGNKYLITSCNFCEYLFELTDVNDEKNSIWVRCENIELVESKKND